MNELSHERLSVSGIKNGTVIDHITPGQAFSIMQLLGLHASEVKATVGLNLQSGRMGRKDLIKIEGRVLTDGEANEIVVFAPLATINVIEQFKVVKKFNTHLPSTMRHVFKCPNPICITQTEVTDQLFHVREQGKQIKLTCHFCEKEYERNEVIIHLSMSTS